jgi:hypothetical protein
MRQILFIFEFVTNEPPIEAKISTFSVSARLEMAFPGRDAAVNVF